MVVGNIAGGKTRLSQRLAEIHDISVTHVDSIQFISGMKVRPLDETRRVLNDIVQKQSWLIDGYGPLDLLEKRFSLSDTIIFVDLPLTRHFFWLAKRQISLLFGQRKELAEGCREATLKHTVQLYRRMWGMHKKMRPELLKIFARDSLKKKMIYVQSKKQWRQLYKSGILKPNLQ